MTYSVGEVAKKLNLSIDTLRYYEKEKLLPRIKRDSSGHREFTDSDIEWVFLIKCLRDTDMRISKIRKYVSLLMKGGEESVRERRDLLLEHEAYVKEKIDSYKVLQKLIDKKISFYNEALAPGNKDILRCTDYAAEWEHFKTILAGMKEV